MSEEINDKGLLWKQYEVLCELYKFYLDLIIKSNLFFYAITGGIMTYIFTNPKIPMMRWSLALPVMLSLSLAVISLRGVKQARELKDELYKLRDELEIGLAPHVDILVFALQSTGVIYLFVAVLMLLLFFFFDLWFLA